MTYDEMRAELQEHKPLSALADAGLQITRELIDRVEKLERALEPDKLTPQQIFARLP